MCDDDLWRGVKLPGDLVHADLTHDDTIVGMAERALAAAPPRFVAIALSMGGIVAFQIARLAPERLEGLVLLDTNPSADTPEKREMRTRQQKSVRAGRLAQVVAEELKPNYLAEANRSRVDLLHRAHAMSLRLGPDVFVRQAEALKTRPDAWQVLSTLQMPVLVACGAEDRLCPPELHERMAAACPGADLSVIDNAGHLTPMEQPQMLSSLIAEWTAKHRIGTAND
ncbi:MAG: alpha/beta hydrolase [Pseudomonadota bacterium]|nr:alpha/beta hydrolase [Pseudomonadota bacterium]